MKLQYILLIGILFVGCSSLKQSSNSFPQSFETKVVWKKIIPLILLLITLQSTSSHTVL